MRVKAGYHHGDLRRELLTQAAALLEEVGSEALSIRELARRAGVSPRAPYQHFEDKEALLSALAVDGFTAFGEALAGAEAIAPSGREIEEQAVAYVRFAVAAPGRFRLMFGPRRVEPGSDLAAAKAQTFHALQVQAGANVIADRRRARACSRLLVVRPRLGRAVPRRPGSRGTGGRSRRGGPTRGCDALEPSLIKRNTIAVGSAFPFVDPLWESCRTARNCNLHSYEAGSCQPRVCPSTMFVSTHACMMLPNSLCRKRAHCATPFATEFLRHANLRRKATSSVQAGTRSRPESTQIGRSTNLGIFRK